jgi:hypothetical protein
MMWFFAYSKSQEIHRGVIHEKIILYLFGNFNGVVSFIVTYLNSINFLPASYRFSSCILLYLDHGVLYGLINPKGNNTST